MKHFSRILVVFSVLGVGLIFGWIFDRGEGRFSGSGLSKKEALQLNRSIGQGVLHVCGRFGFRPHWISVKEGKGEEENKKWPKRVWRIRIPADLPLAVVSLEITKTVVDSGGAVIWGEENLTTRQAILVFGLENLTCDSLILTQDKRISHQKGMIILIIDDFGYDRTETINGFLSFPAKLAISVIPGHPLSQEIAQEAYNHGFEVLIHLPIEPNEPPERQEYLMLKSGMSRGEVRKLIDEAEESISGGIGLNNHMGSKGTEDAELMKFLARELKRRRLFFIDSYTTVKSTAFTVMQDAKVPALKRDIFLDHEDTAEFFLRQMVKLVEISDTKGEAIGIAHATKPLSLALLQEEVPRLVALGYHFIFPSELVYQAKNN